MLFYSIIENEEFIFRCHGKCIKIPINHITPNLHLTRASSWLWKQEIGAHYSLIHFFCLGGKMSDVCKNKNDHLKFSERKMEVDKTHKRSSLVSRLPMWRAVLSTCAAVIIVSLLLPFATCLHLTRYVCSIISWYNTESAHYLPLYSELTMQRRSKSAVRARSVSSVS